MSGDPDILGTYDLEAKVEDCVIVLEATQKNYGDPNRAILIEQGLKDLVATKVKYNKADRFSLVIFGETAKRVLKLEDFSVEAFNSAIEQVELLGTKAKLVDGVALAFQETVESMQKLIEGKQFRILIVGEGQWADTDKESKKKLSELLNVASKIQIFIDTIQVNMRSQDVTLKMIAKETNGGYSECEPGNFTNHATSFANHKKIIEDNTTKEDRDLKGLLELIAKPLNTLESEITTPAKLLELITSQDQKYMCGVCYSDRCMMCKGPAYACGAFCPSCGRFYHLHCAAGWAENSTDTPKNVLKCPSCFHLLKVPGSVHRVNVLKDEFARIYEFPEMKYNAEKIKASELGKDWKSKTCAYCHGIFEDDNTTVFRCGNPNCGAVYHEQCLDKNEDQTKGRCRNCDTIMRRRFDAHRGISRIV
jgi:hypothetical protein